MKKKNYNDIIDDLFLDMDLPTDDDIRNETKKELCSNGGKIGGPKAGKIAKDNKLGFHSMSRTDRVNLSTKIGNEIGPRSYKEGFGIFGLSEEEKIAVAIYAGQQSVKSPKHVNNLQLKCPHCKLVGGYTIMSRWHMDNCRFKK